MKSLPAAVAALVVAGSLLFPAAALAALVVTTRPVTTVLDAPELAPVPSTVSTPERPPAPPVPASAGGPAAPAQPDADARADAGTQAAGSATIRGTVRVGTGTGTGTGSTKAGVIVTATRIDDTDTPVATTDATTKADGTFLVSGLAAGRYWVSFYDDGDPAGDTAMWWGATPQNPFGNDAVALKGSQNLTVDQLVTPTGTVTGRLSTGDLGTTPTPGGGAATATAPGGIHLYLAVLDDADEKFHPVLQLGWNETGRYENDYTLPFSHYAVFAINEGSDRSYANASSSAVFGLGPHQTVDRDTIVAKVVPAVAGVDDATNTVISALYADFLARQPRASEVAYWNGRLENGAGLGEVSAGFVSSDEYRLIRIDAAYRGILGRGADASGRADWLRWMQQGRLTTDDIETSFYASAEYFQAHGGTNTSFAKALYQALLHRDGDAAEHAFWGDLAAQHGRAWVIARFWDSAETISERVTLMYEKYLGRTPDAAGLKHWVGIALAIGDSGLRSGLTGNDEYAERAGLRFLQN